MNCPICGSDKIKQVFPDYLTCGLCNIAYSSANMTESVSPSPPSENKEDVYQHSKKILFAEGLKKLNELLPQKGLLLDVGCGHGYFMKLASDNGWKCEGIEISPNALAYCRETFKLNVYEKPLQTLRLKDNHYDAVTLWGVLDLVPNPKSELDEIYRVIKPGGLLFLRVNNFSYHKVFWKLSQTKFFKRLELQPAVIHRWAINSTSLKVMLKKAGFAKIKFYNSKPTSGDPYRTGGKFGVVFVSIFKNLYYASAQIIYYLTFGKIFISSSLCAIARKK